MSLYLTNSGASLVLATGGIPVAGSSPLARGEHPRLFMVPDGYSHAPTISQVAAQVTTGGPYATSFLSLLRYWESTYGSVNSGEAPTQAQAFAFFWLMHGRITVSGGWAYSKAQYGAFARTCLLSVGSPGGAYNQNCASAYDWLRADADDVLSPADCTALMEDVQVIDTLGYGTTADNTPIGSPGNSYTPLSRVGKILWGCAFANDGVDDTWASGAVNAFESHYRDDRLTTGWERGLSWIWSEWAGEYGGFMQGPDYGLEYSMGPLLEAEEGYRTAMGISKSSHYGTAQTNVYRYLPKCFAYEIIPWSVRGETTTDPGLGGYLWMFAKTHIDGQPTAPNPWKLDERRDIEGVVSLMAGIDNDMAGLAKWLRENRTGSLNGHVYQFKYAPIYLWILQTGLNVTALSPTDLDLPLSVQQARGHWIFRSSWSGNITDPYVALTCPERIGGEYGQTFPGQFTIYRKGPVVHQQGFGIHDPAFGTLLCFPDRSVNYDGLSLASYKSTTAGNNKGQRSRREWNEDLNYTTDWNTENTVSDARAELRERLASGSSDVNYVFANMTKAYDHAAYYDPYGGGPGARVSDYVRQFVYFVPADLTNDSVRIVVYDRYTVASTNIGGEWVMALCGAPTFENGTTSAGPSRGPDGTARKTQSTDTTLVSATSTANNTDSKLWLTPILPDVSSRRVHTTGFAIPTANVYTAAQASAGDTTLTVTVLPGPTAGLVQDPGSDPGYIKYTGVDTGTPKKLTGIPASGDGSIARTIPVDSLIFAQGFEDLYGHMFISGNAHSRSDEPGWFAPYRVHVEPLTRNSSDQFLNAVEVTDSDGSQSTTASITGSTWVGVRIGDRIAVFGSDGYQKTSGTFTIPASFSGKLLVCGLNPSTSRTLDPDAHGTINALSAGQAYTATCGADGTFYVDLVVDGTDCTITVS